MALPEQATPTATPRLPYATPRVVEYGTVSALTQGQPTPTPGGTPTGSQLTDVFEEF